MSLAIKDSIEQPDFDANDKVTITYSVNGTAQEPVEVTTEADYNFYTGAAGEAVKIDSVAWYSTSTELTRLATAFDPTNATVNISATEDNTITVTAWEERADLGVTLKIAEGVTMPDFGGGDQITIFYRVDSGTVQESRLYSLPCEFCTAKAGQMIGIDQVNWYCSETTEIKFAELDPDVQRIMVGSDNAFTITGWR